MKKLLPILLFVFAGSVQGAINVQPDRYIEARHIEVLENIEGTGGMLVVRPMECRGCATQTYEYNHTVRVRYQGKDYPVSALTRWRLFTGDIVIAKSNEKLVAVIRNS